MKNKFFLLFLALFPLFANAEKVQIDGIWYELVSKVKQAEVISADDGTKYEGEVVIPETVEYNEVTYDVTSIGSHAFFFCSSLTSINIPNSVTNIGSYAFRDCSSLTSINIPNSVTSIGDCTFLDCSSLTSVTIPNSVTSIGGSAFSACSDLTSINIPNSVTSIGSSAFSYCDGLTSIGIPNSVTSIGSGAFYRCSSLTSINIPNSVTSIEYYAFRDCSSLTSINIPNSVTSIGDDAFFGCSNLTSITIPNSVTSIGSSAFSGCKSLTSIIIPNSVTKIGDSAFSDCAELTDVYCHAEKVPSTGSDAFADSYIEYATLHVPESAIEDYKTTEPWSGFGTFKTLSGEVVEVEKCATPTISYQSGKLTFACETEGVEFVSEITDEDIKKHYEAEVSIAATYTVSVHATKAGYEDSETAFATLCWVECAKNHEEEEEGNGVINISSTPVLIQTQAGEITLTGLADGTTVTVYSIDGKEAGNGVTASHTATVQTSLQTGDIAIVKIGIKSVKVVMK